MQTTPEYCLKFNIMAIELLPALERNKHTSIPETLWRTHRKATQIIKFMGPTWGPSGSCRPQMGPWWPQGSRWAHVGPMNQLSGNFHAAGGYVPCHCPRPMGQCFCDKTFDKCSSPQQFSSCSCPNRFWLGISDRELPDENMFRSTILVNINISL